MSMKKTLCATTVLLLAGSALASTTVSLPLDTESPLSAEIKALKHSGQPISRELREQASELYGYTLPTNYLGNQRDGGNNAGNATAITFVAGAYSDTGSTVGKGNDKPSRDPRTPGFSCSNQSYSSSMQSEDAWYVFTLTGESTVTASTIFPGTTYDTCLALIDAAGNIVSINDDGEGAPYRSALSCCLAAGTYYVVVDGYSSVDKGDYELHVTSDDTACLPTAFVCPAGALPSVDATTCGDFVNEVFCNSFVCGNIATDTEEDHYWFQLGSAQHVIFNVYGDDTPGQNAFGYGCDPTISIKDFSGFFCDAELHYNDDGGTGFDALIDLGIMPAGQYYITIGAPYTGAQGPYILDIECLPPCANPESNTCAAPMVLTNEFDWTNYQGEANALTVPVSLCDYCSELNIGPGNFQNGLHIEQLNGGELWINAFQPDFNAQCYALVIQTLPAHTSTCTPLVGVCQDGALLGWFATDASAGLLPSLYWNSGTMNSTFVVDAPAACCDQVTIKMWYEDLCPPPADANDLPVDFTLGQNYPNPFNPTTTIEFSVPETAETSLKVFNLNGEVVATLVNGMTERGAHSVSFDASGLTSGMYFYTLESNGFSQTRKMALVK
jgi:hypothetical protein